MMMRGYNQYNPGRIAPVGQYRRPIQMPLPMPMPVQRPMYPAQPFYPGYGANNGVTQFFQGVKEQLQTVGQFVLHPLNPAARRLPYRNPFMPMTGAEEAGRWVVNGALIAGAFFLGRGLLTGNLGAVVGGGARVGSSSGVMYGIGSAIRGVASGIGSVITAPFRFLGNLLGVGAHVGMG